MWFTRQSQPLLASSLLWRFPLGSPLPLDWLLLQCRHRLFLIKPLGPGASLLAKVPQPIKQLMAKTRSVGVPLRLAPARAAWGSLVGRRLRNT